MAKKNAAQAQRERNEKIHKLAELPETQAVAKIMADAVRDRTFPALHAHAVVRAWLEIMRRDGRVIVPRGSVGAKPKLPKLTPADLEKYKIELKRLRTRVVVWLPSYRDGGPGYYDAEFVAWVEGEDRQKKGQVRVVPEGADQTYTGRLVAVYSARNPKRFSIDSRPKTTQPEDVTEEESVEAEATAQ